MTHIFTATMRNKLLLLTFAVLLPLAAHAQNCFYKGIYFKLDMGNAVVMPLPDGEKYSGKISIPESVPYVDPDWGEETYSVTTIGYGAFQDCTELTSVSIPSSVETIWTSAFQGCTGLTSIHIPSSVTTIGYSAFQGCTDLTSIDIPNGVTEIRMETFQSCTNLTSVSIPSSVTEIGQRAFQDCTGLASIDIPQSVTEIGLYAFRDCSSLTSFTIPSGVTEIARGVFIGCSSLTSVYIPSGVTRIGDYAFSGCKNLTSITIPNGVTHIGSFAFRRCMGLTSIDIPSSVTYIGEGAWALAGSKLASIEVDSNNKVYDSRSHCNAIIETASNKLICGCANTNLLTSVTSIGDWAFSGCTDLTYVHIPWNVESIGDVAFTETGLTSITTPLSVKSIGKQAFFDCPDLVFVVMSSEIESIGSEAFASCPNLTKVYCYATKVPSAPDNAFFEDMEGYQQASLFVQSGYADVYRSKTPWKWFKYIFVLADDGISSEEAESVKLRSEGGFLLVEGVGEGTMVSVYTTDGRLIGLAVSHGGTAQVGTLPQQAGTVVVVKIGEKTYKMAVR